MFLTFQWPKLTEADIHNLYEELTHYGLLVLQALILLFIGLKLIKWLIKRLNKRLDKSKIDPSLKSFLTPMISVIFKSALFITIISIFGVEVTSFIAILSTFGLAVGLALQGSLSNFAGGVLILLLKPFKVGDFIEAQGFSGTVKDIHIFYTILSTPDNKKVVIPNSGISNSSLINYSAYPTRRLELKVSCSYDSDIFVVKDLLKNLVDAHASVLKEPVPVVYLVDYAASSIVFMVRAWVKSEDYWTVYYDILLQVKGVFDKNNITIPYPQMDLRVIEKK